jgi:hypothetical protein
LIEHGARALSHLADALRACGKNQQRSASASPFPGSITSRTHAPAPAAQIPIACAIRSSAARRPHYQGRSVR